MACHVSAAAAEARERLEYLQLVPAVRERAVQLYQVSTGRDTSSCHDYCRLPLFQAFAHAVLCPDCLWSIQGDMERFDENVVDIRRQQKEEATKANEVTLIITNATRT